MYVSKEDLPEHLIKEIPKEGHLWEEFFKCLFTDEQIRDLKRALKTNQHVYFYGTSLGKSVLAEVLLKAGFKASEPGMYKGGYSLYMPDGEDFVPFELKEPREYIQGEDIREALMADVEYIRQWINL